MENPTITITGIGRSWFNYTIDMKEGGELIKGAARSGEPILIPTQIKDNGNMDNKTS